MNLTPDQIDSISQDLQSELRCFVHRETGENVTVPSLEASNYVDEELWQEEFDKLYNDPSNFIEIEPMSSQEAFKVMEEFAEMTPRYLKARLLTALEKHKPFQHFKNVIHDEGEWRERWFAFHDERYKVWVASQL